MIITQVTVNIISNVIQAPADALFYGVVLNAANNYTASFVAQLINDDADNYPVGSSLATSTVLKDDGTYITLLKTLLSNYVYLDVADTGGSTDASTLTQGTLPDGRLSANVAFKTDVETAVGNISKTSLGLGSVDNTSDLNKPVSTAQTNAISAAIQSINAGTIGLGNVNNTSDNQKPVSTAQAIAISQAVQAITATSLGLGNVNNTSDINKPVSTAQSNAISQAIATVTVASLGLGNVNNTSDANKPISTAVATALTGKENTANKNTSNGYAGLDANGLLFASQYPAGIDKIVEYANFALFPTVGLSNTIYLAIDTLKQYRWSGSVYSVITSTPGNTDAVPEGSTNLYFTNARVASYGNTLYPQLTGSYSNPSWIAALAYSKLTGVPTNLSQFTNNVGFITSTFINAPSPLSYNSGTGAITIQQSSSTQAGYLSAADWITFNSGAAKVYYDPDLFSGGGTSTSDYLTIPVVPRSHLPTWYPDSTYFQGGGTSLSDLFTVIPAAFRSLISLTTVGTSGAATYNQSTGVLNIPNYAVSGGGGISALTGDATASGTGSVAITFATVNSNVGTFNNVTVNAKGLVTAASNVSYQSALSGTGFVKITGTTISYDNSTYLTTTVAASTYQPTGSYITALTGDATASGPGSVAVTLKTVNTNIGTFNSVTVNGKGLVTAATTIAYQAPLTFDSAPTSGSTNPVTSGGVYTALNNSSAISFGSGFTTTTSGSTVIGIDGTVVPLLAQANPFTAAQTITTTSGTQLTSAYSGTAYTTLGTNVNGNFIITPTGPSPSTVVNGAMIVSGGRLRLDTGQYISGMDNTSTEHYLMYLDASANGLLFSTLGNGFVWDSKDLSGDLMTLSETGEFALTTYTTAGILVNDTSGNVTTTTFTSGSIPYSTGGGLTQNNATLFFDATNHRLGVGTNTFTSTGGAAIEISDATSSSFYVTKTGSSAGTFGMYNDGNAHFVGETVGGGLMIFSATTTSFRATKAGSDQVIFPAAGGIQIAVGGLQVANLTTAGVVLTSSSGVISSSATLPVANGGTGSATQNFVDLTTTQTIGGSKTFSGSTILFSGTIGATSSNLYIPAAANASSQTATNQLYASATTVFNRVVLGIGNGATTLTTGSSYTAALIGKSIITTFTSGTHALLASAVINTPTITSGGATITQTATLYVNGAPTLGTNNAAIAIAGNTSGVIGINVQAIAGTYSYNLPITAGTSGFAQISGGGGTTAMTWAAVLFARTSTPVSTTATVTVVANVDQSVRLTAAAAYTVTISTAVGITGTRVTLKVISGANTITIGTTSSQTIDGATTYTLAALYKYVTLESNGTNWDVVANN